MSTRRNRWKPTTDAEGKRARPSLSALPPDARFIACARSTNARRTPWSSTADAEGRRVLSSLSAFPPNARFIACARSTNARGILGSLRLTQKADAHLPLYPRSRPTRGSSPALDRRMRAEIAGSLRLTRRTRAGSARIHRPQVMWENCGKPYANEFHRQRRRKICAQRARPRE